MIVRAPLAYVRLAEGGTVALRKGATVPVGADEQHVGRLAAAGVLGERDTPEADSVEAIERFVGDDQARAVEYIELERAKPEKDQRKSLIAKLEPIAEPKG